MELLELMPQAYLAFLSSLLKYVLPNFYSILRRGIFLLMNFLFFLCPMF